MTPCGEALEDSGPAASSARCETGVAAAPRKLPRLVLSIALVAALAVPSACATRPGPDVLEVASTQPVTGKHVTIFAATPRQREGSGYSEQRSPQLNFERFTISVPERHKKTEIEWPSGKPDPACSFAVIDRTVLSRKEFSELPAPADSPQSVPNKRDILVFVHGYNYNFQEALFRLAQIAADGKLPETRSCLPGPLRRLSEAMSLTGMPSRIRGTISSGCCRSSPGTRRWAGSPCSATAWEPCL